MITVEKLLSFDKNNLEEISKSIPAGDMPKLVEWLEEEDDKIRYKVLLLLQYRSTYCDDVYSFWDVFCQKLGSDNSYQRSIGLMLLADNTKWDKDNKMDSTIDEYMKLLNDEKPITVRQCIQSLNYIIPYKCHLHQKIADKIMSVPVAELEETMRKLILIDILHILVLIRKCRTSNEIERYIFDALTGGLLDKKSVKQIEALL